MYKEINILTGCKYEDYGDFANEKSEKRNQRVDKPLFF